MTDATQPSVGSVVWIELADAKRNVKSRPAIVVAVRELDDATFAHLVAVTTQLTQPLPDDYVLLPWSRQSSSRSGLRKKCAAVARWQEMVPIEQLSEVVGIVSDDVVNQILRKMDIE